MIGVIMAHTNLRIEPLQPGDWPEVRRILEEGIATGQATFETEAPSWETWDRSHLPGHRLVGRDGSRVAGWAAISPFSPRPAYAGVAEVSVYVAEVSVYVAEDAQGQGIGGALLDALVDSSERGGIWTLQAVLFPENEASLRLHRSAGFREVGRRERIGRLHGAWRDTVLLERRSEVVG